MTTPTQPVQPATTTTPQTPEHTFKIQRQTVDHNANTPSQPVKRQAENELTPSQPIKRQAENEIPPSQTPLKRQATYAAGMFRPSAEQAAFKPTLSPNKQPAGQASKPLTVEVPPHIVHRIMQERACQNYKIMPLMDLQDMDRRHKEEMRRSLDAQDKEMKKLKQAQHREIADMGLALAADSARVKQANKEARRAFTTVEAMESLFQSQEDEYLKQKGILFYELTQLMQTHQNALLLLQSHAYNSTQELRRSQERQKDEILYKHFNLSARPPPNK